MKEERTRVSYLRKIANERRFSYQISELIQTENILESKGQIKMTEVIRILVLNQLNLQYLRNMVELTYNYGVLTVIIALFLGMFILTMPLFLLYFFIGIYSRNGYIKVWNCTPLLKGLGITMGIIAIFNEYYSSIMLSLSLLCLAYIFHRKIPWIDCSYYSPLFCIDQNTSPNPNLTNICMLPEQAFIIEHFNFGNYNTFEPNYKLIVLFTFQWFIVWIISYNGFQRILKISIYYIWCIVIFLIPKLIVSIMYSRNTWKRQIVFSGYSKIFSKNFFLRLTDMWTAQIGPSFIIFAGAIAPDFQSSKTITAYVFLGKVSITSLFLFWYIICFENTLYFYRNFPCLPKFTTGFEIQTFCLEYLYSLPLGRFWAMMWLLHISFFSILSISYTVTALLESIMEVLPKKLSKRGYVNGIICGLAAVINLGFTIPQGIILELIIGLTSVKFAALISGLISLMAIDFIYSLNTVIQDMYFYYGRRPSNYWITSWVISSIILLYSVILNMFSNHFKVIQKKWPFPFASYTPSILFFLLLSPIVTYASYLYLKYLNNTSTKLLKAKEEWGPQGAVMKTRRKVFRPDRDVRYKHTILKCKHKCLINSTQYEEEKWKQIMKYRNIVDSINVDY